MTANPQKQRYIGLMSGTSMDALDCALIEISEDSCTMTAFLNLPLPESLRKNLLALCSGKVTLSALIKAERELADLSAEAVDQLLAREGLEARDIIAIGSHGQTLWHEPISIQGNAGSTLQIGDPNRIAELTGITTIADFRRRDMAAGGEGAPLVPLFHQQVLAMKTNHDLGQIILNLGGIANITILKLNSPPIGLDTGPANILMDSWIHHEKQLPFDSNGEWASSGKYVPELLHAMLEDPYFKREAPKSTGRELFNLSWLQKHIHMHNNISAVDVQATLLTLTVESIALEIEKRMTTGEIIVCGGGARNHQLIKTIKARLPSFFLNGSSAYGIDEDYVEAAAFAWFAAATIAGKALDFSPFTGSKGARIAGGVYKA